MSFEEKEFLKSTYTRIIESVRPKALFDKYLKVHNGTLYYRNIALDLSTKGKFVLAGTGKASLTMAKAILSYLDKKPDETLLIPPSDGHEELFTVVKGDHPIPLENSLKAGKRLMELVSSLNENDTLLYLLSGGSSALVELPHDGVSSDDLEYLTCQYLAKGLEIHEINTLRGSVSQLKSGGLASRCKAKCYVIVMSDVMGNDMSVIGSGLLSQMDLDKDSVVNVLYKYSLHKIFPDHILKIMYNYEPPEKTSKINPHFLIGSNADLLQAAELACLNEGIHPITYPASLFGEAQEAAEMIVDMMKKYNGPKPACMIYGGEPTVTLCDNPGLGGRAQELTLKALDLIKDHPEFTILSAGSDGIDGVGGAAGAVISSDTYQKAKKLGLSIQSYLNKHDSYHFHEQCGSLIVTGYSGTNVGDIVMALISDDLLERSVS